MVDQHLRQPREVAALDGEDVRAETERAQPGLGFRQLDRVGVESQQSSAGPEPREYFPRMATVTERAIHGQFARPGRQHFQDFRHHDGTMRARRGFAGREDFGDGFRVTFRLVFFVFVLEPARVPAGVTPAPPVRGRWRDRYGAVSHAVKMREFGKRSENVLVFAWERRRLADNPERGCLSRSSSTIQKSAAVRESIWPFRPLRVGHPRSVSFGPLAGEPPVLPGLPPPRTT